MQVLKRLPGLKKLDGLPIGAEVNEYNKLANWTTPSTHHMSSGITSAGHDLYMIKRHSSEILGSQHQGLWAAGEGYSDGFLGMIGQVCGYHPW